MEAKAYPLNQILTLERRYVIPTYQRDYEWTLEGQWQLLFDDLEQVAGRLADARARANAAGQDIVRADKTVGPHFLGAIVLDQLPALAGSVDLRAVIDGQQRLTTLQLLIRGLLDAIDGNHRVPQLRRLLRNPDDIGEEDERYKLWPRRHDRDAWRQAMAEVCDLTDKHPYLAARRYFAQRSRQFISRNGDKPEQEDLLIDSVLGLFKLVVIDLEENDDAQVIFEVLNGRQTPLSAADLVKNLLFLRAELRGGNGLESLYDNYWAQFDDTWWKKEVGRGHAARRHSDSLLASWLTAVDAREITASRLYGEVRSYLDRSRRTVTDVLEEIKAYASEYRAIYGLVPETNARIAKAYQRLLTLGVTTALPLLLWLRILQTEGLEEREHEAAVVAIESFVIRRMLLGAQTRAYGRVFIQVLAGTRDRWFVGSPGLAEVVKSELRKKPQGAHWPSDEEVSSACASRRFYGVDSPVRLRLLLGAVDSHLRERNPKAEPAAFDYDKLTIEHVMPQSWRAHWAVTETTEPERTLAEQRRDAAINKLGNLTLVTGSLNPDLSNADWPTKREKILQHSVLLLNTEIAHLDRWDEESIDARGATLAVHACAIWPRPHVESPEELAGPSDPGTHRAQGYEWSRIEAAVEAIPGGYWTTYGILAELGGTGAQAVGNKLATASHLVNAYRVLDHLGRVSSSFRWPDPADARDPLVLLRDEGIEFDEDGRADPEHRLSAYELAQLVPERFNDDELEALRRSDRAGKPAGVDQPWLVDGREWHLVHRCTEKTRMIVERLVGLIALAAPGIDGPDWGQKHYVSWRAGSRTWIWAVTHQSLVWLNFQRAASNPELVAQELGGVWVPDGETASTKASGPIQVTGGRFPLRIMIRETDQVTGEAGERLVALVAREADSLPPTPADTRREQVVELLAAADEALDDDEIAHAIGIAGHHVNRICRALAKEGLITREYGTAGRLANRWVNDD